MKVFFYKIAHRLAKIYWFIFRPETAGAKCLIKYDHQFLLVRHTYGDGKWTLPGGGVKRGEDAEHTIKREVLEEVGLNLKTLKKIGEFKQIKEYKHDTVHCFLAIAKDPLLKIDRGEIAEAKWFSSVPSNHSSTIDYFISISVL